MLPLSIACLNIAGSFGLCDPASKEMHHYLERLEEQQKLVLELITGKKQALIEHMQSKDQIQIKQVSYQACPFRTSSFTEHSGIKAIGSFFVNKRLLSMYWNRSCVLWCRVLKYAQ